MAKTTITDAKRCEIIARIDDWACSNDVQVNMLGMPDARKDYAAAIIGVVLEPHPAVVYDYSKLLGELQRIHNFTEEDAIEWYEFNIVRSLPYCDNSPIIITGITDV